MSDTAVMPRKPKPDPQPPAGKKARKTLPVQISHDLARMAAVIAAHDDVSVGELLNDYLRPFLRENYERVQREIAARLKAMGQADGG